MSLDIIFEPFSWGKDRFPMRMAAPLSMKGFEDGEYICITAPSGKVHYRPIFKNYEYSIVRDKYGYCFPWRVPGTRHIYEARFSADEEGVHSYSVRRKDGSEIFSGELTFFDKGYDGYIGISKNDPKYFAFEGEDRCFVPIGINMPEPKMEEAPKGKGHYIIGGKEYRTLVTRDYRRILNRMNENGVNLVKIRIGGTIFDARTESLGVYNYGAFALLDSVLHECRIKKIKVILSFDNPKSFSFGKDYSVIKRDEDGSILRSPADYIKSEYFRENWMIDLRGYFYRYGDDPMIFAFELFDEMDRIEGIDMKDIEVFTKHATEEITKAFPTARIINSLSKCDTEEKKKNQKKMGEFGLFFDQIHRTFDLLAELPECTDNIREMAFTAIQDFRTKKRPILMTSTGASSYGEDAPFLYYKNDPTGVIFKDAVFAPFFSGAAGTGIIGHTFEYIDSNNLWSQFKSFSEMINTMKVDKQHFRCEKVERRWFTAMYMHGRTTTLIYIRAKRDNWEYILMRDYHYPPIPGQRIQNLGRKRATIFPFADEPNLPQKIPLMHDKEFYLPAFSKGMFLRLR